MRYIFFLCCMLALLEVAAQGELDNFKQGKKLYMVHCARCHGVLGNGGTGPSLTRPNLPRATTDEKFASIISNGIEGTGMPFNWMLEGKDVENIIKYVRSLSKQDAFEITGDAIKGKELFKGSSCSNCHVVAGVGGTTGPELTKVGLKRGSSFMRTAITHPGQSKTMDYNGFYEFLLVKIQLKSGEEITGIRVNEDTFSIQIKDASNAFKTYVKQDIETLEKLKEQSLMPGFSDQFTESELQDLVAYLSTLK